MSPEVWAEFFAAIGAKKRIWNDYYQLPIGNINRTYLDTHGVVFPINRSADGMLFHSPVKLILAFKEENSIEAFESFVIQHWLRFAEKLEARELRGYGEVRESTS